MFWSILRWLASVFTVYLLALAVVLRSNCLRYLQVQAQRFSLGAVASAGE